VSRVDETLERVFGALGDWLELVRAHEVRRREVMARHRRLRRAQGAAVAAAALCAALVAVFILRARG